MAIAVCLGEFLGGAIFLLFVGKSDAFAPGSSTIGAIDLDKTLPLTTAAFWRFAHSECFYRQTRQQSETVRQEVVDLSNWVQANDISTGSQTDLTSVAPAARLERILPRRPPQQQYQSPPQPCPQVWQRKARLNYAISTPFGSSEATAVQEHMLHDRQREGGGISYSESDCITGFPLIPGDVYVKTIFLVTPAEDGDPERVRVRMGVEVGEIELPVPRRFKFLSKRVSNLVGNGARNQAERWLGEMMKAESLAAEP